MNISLLGAGAWGTALAISLAQRHRVTLWARNAQQINDMKAAGKNQRYLPDIPLPQELRLEHDLGAALAGAEMIVLAVPISALRDTLGKIAALPAPVPVIWLCKGFEADTALLAHQVVDEILPPAFPRGVLSGPSFAQEVAHGLPTALVLASNDREFARQSALSLHNPRLRIYTSNDVIGVEVGGAVKNVLAIAAGISDGMGFGFNTRAALLTRGLSEMTRLGIKLGGHAETLAGLSGVGDLILTCTGDLSRNRNVGLLLAQQHALPFILRELGHVAEGVYSVRAVHQLVQQLGIDMPICEAVYRILYEQVEAASAVEDLLNRVPDSEFPL
ncbi:MAG: glycerol-3-phosphate dehydrogenase [Gallionellales bacterium 35-53-114]|jgi:glycerol-3-phosphate dehydrogenase (NAD(P)+)|nr:MAG: glycerol-3-phosphate dehydrogenase [Gallionellales bacterium 35-53-114]OYZ64401.1 MAG: glycerol-3-phosphate dehydrogenase [Gallionellales bacterium 24-53-125]OZB10291.1 MAG: glycerol-3-phosphate dehydrogenase [Gallionellales bacterium 39-52-133]HQS56888.1 NAD(P)H-dependent glycerol-3-phosphate dehydrogenase [Gallionellaceae bacterium]HQS75328.1 NAD(P)H-dependent glycerol-3-phosphate dehydrogenase [Gallionellaceae bacterium]